MAFRGIRGAITVNKNQKAEIVAAAENLLRRMVAANKIKVEDVAAAIFSTTRDLNAEFPAVAARNLGWIYTPLLCTNEIMVTNSLKKCIRVLLLVNSSKKQKDLKHVYLDGAKTLRPDLNKKTSHYCS